MSSRDDALHSLTLQLLTLQQRIEDDPGHLDPGSVARFEAALGRLWDVCDAIRRVSDAPGPRRGAVQRAAHAYLTWMSIHPGCAPALAWMEDIARLEYAEALAALRAEVLGQAPPGESGPGSPSAHLLPIDFTKVEEGSIEEGRLDRIVRAGTLHPAGAHVRTAMRCRNDAERDPPERACRGRLVIVRCGEAPALIAWSCETCGDGGSVHGFEGSSLDLRARRRTSPREGELELSLAPEVVDGMTAWCSEGPAEEVAFAATAGPDGQLLLRATVEDICAAMDLLERWLGEGSGPPSLPDAERSWAALDDVLRAIECDGGRARADVRHEARRAELDARLSAARRGELDLRATMDLRADIRGFAALRPTHGAFLVRAMKGTWAWA